MKNFVFLLIIFIGCTPQQAIKRSSDYAFSPNFDVFKPYRVAVLLPSSNVNIEKSIISSLSDFIPLEFLKINGFEIIEREKIDKILEEQAFGLTGVIDPQTAAKVGKILGVDAVILSQIDYIKKDMFFKDDEVYDGMIFLKMIDTSTGEILYYGKGLGKSFEGKLQTLIVAISNALKPLIEKRGLK